MKSRINTLADYRETPLERNVVIRCPEEHIQAQLRHLTRPFKRTEPVQTLEKGDVAVLALGSELEKFNKPTVFVTVGGGLFDADFEEKLMGHSVGESFEVSVEGKPVAVTVKQASRTVFPEPTDEMAASYAAEHEEFKDAKTVAAYRELVRTMYIKEKRIDTMLEAQDEMMRYVVTHSDFDFDEGEVAEILEQMHEEVSKELQGRGLTLERLTGRQVREIFGMDSLEELEAMMRSQAEIEIATNLWLMRIHGKNSVEEIEGYPYGFLDEYAHEIIRFTEEN